MKKNFITILFLATSFTASFAQLSDEKRHYVSINAGVSNPLGDYSSTSETNDNAQYAATGIAANFEGAFYFTNMLGVGASIGNFRNTLNQREIKKQLDNDLQNSSFTSYDLKYGSWVNTYALVGPYLAIPFNKITLDFKVLGGFMSSTSPQLDIKLYEPGNPTYNISQNSSTAAAFAYNIGAGMRFNFNSRWALKANVDYISANQSMEVTTTTIYNSNYTKETETQNVNVTSLNGTIGVAFQFVK